jgi:8-oxo-dGTP pyrophosphatase MutT (NUDIX family)
VYFTKEFIIEKLGNELPGIAAHQKMMNYSRIDAKKARESKIEFREGSVLILLFPIKKILHTLLMLRPEYEGVHSAQVSFPGGKKDHEDKDLLETALREAKEEVGITINRSDVLGKLTEIYIPPSKFLVTPFIAMIDYLPDFVADPREVQELIQTPLASIFDDNIMGEKEIFIPILQSNMKTPYFDISGKIVWGATAMMIMELKQIINS